MDITNEYINLSFGFKRFKEGGELNMAMKPGQPVKPGSGPVKPGQSTKPGSGPTKPAQPTKR